MTANTQIRTIRNKASWRGSMLVTSTCIGGGMIAMPVQTAEAGFYLSAATLFISWFFMTFTGLLLVEATGWFKNELHFSSIAQALLGSPGKILCLIIYLFMNVASLVAYTSGGAILLDQWTRNIFGTSLGYSLSCILFTIIFGVFVSLGIRIVGRVNVWMVVVMGGIYCYMVAMGMFHLKGENLIFRPAWFHCVNSFPLIIAAFSYQMIIPSLCSYLEYDVRDLKKSIVIGTSIPFLVYLMWLLVIHGVVPLDGAWGLRETFAQGSMITEPLKRHFNNASIVFVVDVFAFLALSTSYVGLSVALFDFMRDLFKGMGKIYDKNSIVYLSIIPSLVLAIYFPRALLDFLDLTGGFGDALLSCLIPIVIVWIGRYRRQIVSEYQTPGGKYALLLAGGFSVFVFIYQIVKLIWRF